MLGRKRPADGPGLADWLAVALLSVAGVGLRAMGGLRLLDGEDFGFVLLAFGTLATAFGLQDVRLFRTDGGDPWFVQHIVRMSAAHVAAVSAVSAVNLLFPPSSGGSGRPPSPSWRSRNWSLGIGPTTEVSRSETHS